MNFKECLNNYIKEYSISGKTLASQLNISEATMSRYRTGKNVPIKNSEFVKNLSEIIYDYITSTQNNNSENIPTCNQIYDTLNQYCEDESNVSIIIDNFNIICNTLHISNKDIANYLHYDPSFISRIRSKQRIPLSINEFVSNVADYIVKKHTTTEQTQIIDELLKTNYSLTKNDTEKIQLITTWLMNNTSTPSEDSVSHFLKNLNDFNLDTYIKAIHFDEIKVPSVPFTFNTSKFYYGTKEMCDAELDFLKATVLSKSKEDVFMCSDMPMEEMSKIEDFPKKWMFGLAMILKKGLHINIIHNLDRPFNEMMLGLEAWIPLYMTGLVSPYYLKDKHNSLYCRINYSSGSAALCGECITGHHNDGQYYVTKKPNEVKYYKKKAKLILEKAKPLMQIFKSENKMDFNSFIENNINTIGNRTYILSVPPIFSLNEDSLTNICKRNKLTNEETTTLLELRKKRIEYYETIVANNLVSIKLYTFSREEFEASPLSLDISEAFIDKDITYTYEEYLEHIETTKKLSEGENINFEIIDTPGFKNLQISINENNYAIISKGKTPTIQFVIHHPKLIDALQNMVITYVE